MAETTDALVLDLVEWVAREPRLMCGAKGRASSLRSTDYHNCSCRRQQKLGGTFGHGPMPAIALSPASSHPIPVPY